MATHTGAHLLPGMVRFALRRPANPAHRTRPPLLRGERVLIEERAEGLSTSQRAELLHCVAAHHDGRAARTAEAAVLFHANQLDAGAATLPTG